LSMADGTEAPYKPNVWVGRPPPLPDEMKGSPITMRLPNGEVIVTGHVVIRPNDPAPPRDEPTPDRRPGTLFTGPEFTEEYWNARLAENERKRQAAENDIPTL
jgi:hypothetical protein